MCTVNIVHCLPVVQGATVLRELLPSTVVFERTEECGWTTHTRLDSPTHPSTLTYHKSHMHKKPHSHHMQRKTTRHTPTHHPQTSRCVLDWDYWPALSFFVIARKVGRFFWQGDRRAKEGHTYTMHTVRRNKKKRGGQETGTRECQGRTECYSRQSKQSNKKGRTLTEERTTSRLGTTEMGGERPPKKKATATTIIITRSI